MRLISLLASNSAVETGFDRNGVSHRPLKDHAGEKTLSSAEIGQYHAFNSDFNRWWAIAGDRQVMELRNYLWRRKRFAPCI